MRNTRPYPIRLTEPERETLEAIRIALGLRSWAEAIRHLITAAAKTAGAG